jgi:hypothetical protein
MYKQKKVPSSISSWATLAKDGTTRTTASTRSGRPYRGGVEKKDKTGVKKYTAHPVDIPPVGRGISGSKSNRRHRAAELLEEPPAKKRPPSPSVEDQTKLPSEATTTTSEDRSDEKTVKATITSSDHPIVETLETKLKEGDPPHVSFLYNSQELSSPLPTSSRGLQFSAEAMSVLRERNCDPNDKFVRCNLTAIQLYDEKGSLWMSNTSVGCKISKVKVPAKYIDFVRIDENCKGKETPRIDFTQACFERLGRLLRDQSTTVDDIRSMKNEIDVDAEEFHRSCSEM